MSDLLTPGEIERLARQAGVPIAEVCRRAGIAISIFARWKAGKTEPNMVNYRRIRDTVLSLEPLPPANDSRNPPKAPNPSKPKRRPAANVPSQSQSEAA